MRECERTWRWLLAALFCAAGCTEGGEKANESKKPDRTPESGAPGDADPPNDPAARWTKLGFDLASTYNNTAETKLTRDNAGTLREAYVFDVGSSATGSTVLIDDRAYVMTGAGTFCYDLTSGEKCWEEPAIIGSSTLAYEDGVLYAHTLNAELYALNAEDGSIEWGPTDTKDHPNGTGYSSPVVAGDLIIVGAATGEVSQDPMGFRGFLFAAKKETGEKAWQRFTAEGEETGVAIWSTVSVDVERSVVYASTGNNYQEPASDKSDAILALDLESGTIEWVAQRTVGDVFSRYALTSGPDFDFGANPILFEVDDGGTTRRLVAAGQKSGDIHVLDRDEQGAEVCKRNLGPGNASGSAGVFVNGAWDGTRLLFAENGQTSDAPGSKPAVGDLPTSVLFAVDPLTCDILWERQLPSVVMGPLSVANGVGFVGWGETLEAFDTETGEELFTYETAATIASCPTISDGRVAVGSGLPWIFGTPGNTVHVLELP